MFTAHLNDYCDVQHDEEFHGGRLQLKNDNQVTDVIATAADFNCKVAVIIASAGGGGMNALIHGTCDSDNWGFYGTFSVHLKIMSSKSDLQQKNTNHLHLSIKVFCITS